MKYYDLSEIVRVHACGD